jgi:hypothetical protein
MLPVSYQLPAALVLLLGGIAACFFGYRFFRIVLAVFGFILGGLAASSVMSVSDTTQMVVAAAAGGLAGAGILFAAYFVGVALVGAGLGAAAANVLFSMRDREPAVVAVVFCAIAGAVAATYLKRYFIIVGTGFGGAWTVLVGALALVGNEAALTAARSGRVWVAYPLNPAPDQRWVPLAWIVLAIIGTVVQLGWTGGERGRIGRRKKKS